MTLTRALLLLALVALIAPQSASCFFCRYPIQRLTGLAHLADGFVKLDLDVKLIGPECEVTIDGGRFRCSRVGYRTLGVRFTPPARGRCPAATGTVLPGPSSYVPRSNGEPIADVVIEVRLKSGGECTIAGLSPTITLGGPIASILGTILCKRPSGEPVGQGSVELLRRPLPPLISN